MSLMKSRFFAKKPIRLPFALSVFCIFWVLILNNLQSSCSASETSDLSAEAMNAYRTKNYDDAVACFDKLIKLGDTNAYFGRGMALNQKHEYDKAIEDLNESIRQRPLFAIAFEVRGDAYSGKNDHIKAVSDYSKAIKINPEMGAAYLARAEQYIYLKQLDTALIDLHTAILLLSGSTNANNLLHNAFFELATIYFGRGEYNQALVYYNNCIEQGTKSSISYLNRGYIYLWKEEYKKAISDYNEAILLNANDADGYNHLGWLLATCPDITHRDGQKALDCARKACDITEWKESVCLETYAAAEAENGNFTESVKWENKAIELGLKDKKLTLAQERLELYKQHKPFHEAAK